MGRIENPKRKFSILGFAIPFILIGCFVGPFVYFNINFSATVDDKIAMPPITVNTTYRIYLTDKPFRARNPYSVDKATYDKIEEGKKYKFKYIFETGRLVIIE